MTVIQILWISLIIYAIVMIAGYLLNVKWLFLVGGLLWFVPITLVTNAFIITVSAVMVLAHGVFALHTNNEEEF